MIELEWFHWFVLGIGFVLLELSTLSFYVLLFGLGALVVAATTYLFPDLPVPAQLALFSMSSAAAVVSWLVVQRHRRSSVQIDKAQVEFLGETGLLVKPIGADQVGLVRFQRPVMGEDEWRCIASEPIPAGSRVRIEKVHESVLTVSLAGTNERSFTN